MKKNLNDLEFDALKEISSVGAGHASIALSRLTDQEIEVSFPNVYLCPLEDLPSKVGESDEEITNIFLHIDGKDKTGEFEICSLLFLFPKKSALMLSSIIQDSGEEKEDFTDMDISALKEVGNILAGSCFSAMAEFIEFEMVESLPDLSSDMLQSVMDPVIAKHANDTDDALIFNTELAVNKEKIHCNFIVMFYSKLREILRKIKYIREVEDE